MEVVVIILVFANALTLLLLAYTRIDVEYNREMSEIEISHIKEMINIRERADKGEALFPEEELR